MSAHKNGFEPLCDKHHRPMTEITLPAGPESRSAYRCEQPDCQRHYTFANGYFDLIDHRIFLCGQQVCCPRDAKPMYLSTVDAETGTLVWQCPCLNCEQCQQTCDEELEVCPSYELLGE